MTARDLLYCTGFWAVAGNEKRSAAHYARLLPGLMRAIRGGRLHLHHDDPDVLARFAAAGTPFGVRVEGTRAALDDLSTRTTVMPILETCRRIDRGALALPPRRPREKAWDHYLGDWLRSGPEAFHDMLTIWTAKVPLAAALAREHGAVAWIDASVAKFEGNRTGWDFARATWPPERLAHYASPMRYHGEPLPLNASVLAAEPETWTKVAAAFEAELAARAGDGYLNDEEVVLGHVVAARPDLFHCLGRPARGLHGLPLKVAARIRRGLGR
jgi:hypothetical protein